MCFSKQFILVAKGKNEVLKDNLGVTNIQKQQIYVRKMDGAVELLRSHDGGQEFTLHCFTNARQYLELF